MLGLCLVAIGSLASAFATQALWLEMSRVVVAAGAVMTIPSVATIAAFLFPDERPRAVAFVLMGMTLAIVLGVPLGTFVAGAWGWHAPLFGADSACLRHGAACAAELNVCLVCQA